MQVQDLNCDLFQVTPQKVPVKRVKKQVSSTESGTPLTNDVAAAEKIAPKLLSTKKKATFGKEWELFMKECIRDDRELNLRIVRYEVWCVPLGEFSMSINAL